MSELSARASLVHRPPGGGLGTKDTPGKGRRGCRGRSARGGMGAVDAASRPTGPEETSLAAGPQLCHGSAEARGPDTVATAGEERTATSAAPRAQV